MTPCCAGYDTLLCRLCLAWIENKANSAQLELGLGLSLAILSRSKAWMSELKMENTKKLVSILYICGAMWCNKNCSLEHGLCTLGPWLWYSWSIVILVHNLFLRIHDIVWRHRTVGSFEAQYHNISKCSVLSSVFISYVTRLQCAGIMIILSIDFQGSQKADDCCERCTLIYCNTLSYLAFFVFRYKLVNDMINKYFRSKAKMSGLENIS